jgi:hypothetical protein
MISAMRPGNWPIMWKWIFNMLALATLVVCDATKELCWQLPSMTQA